MKMSKEHLGFLYGILASLAISIASIFVKLSNSISTESMVFFRFAIGLILLFPWMIRHRVTFSFKRLHLNLIRDIAGIGAVYCFFYSIKHIPLINATTLRNTSPLFISLIVFVWLRTLIPKQRLLAIAMGFIGVIAILRPTGGFTLFASIIGLLGGFCSALGLVAVQKLSRYESAYSILLTYFIVSTVITAGPMIATWQPIESPLLWGYLICIGFFEAIFQFLLTLSFTHTHSSKASLTIYLMVIFNGLFGWIIWGEIPDLWDALGVSLIVLGGIITLLDKTKLKQEN